MKNFLFFAALLVLCVFAGCVRFAGSAGYWKKNADQDEAEYHGAGFDTQKLLPQKNQGNITVAP